MGCVHMHWKKLTIERWNILAKIGSVVKCFAKDNKNIEKIS